MSVLVLNPPKRKKEGNMKCRIPNVPSEAQYEIARRIKHAMSDTEVQKAGGHFPAWRRALEKSKAVRDQILADMWGEKSQLEATTLKKGSRKGEKFVPIMRKKGYLLSEIGKKKKDAPATIQLVAESTPIEFGASQFVSRERPKTGTGRGRGVRKGYISPHGRDVYLARLSEIFGNKAISDAYKGREDDIRKSHEEIDKLLKQVVKKARKERTGVSLTREEAAEIKKELKALLTPKTVPEFLKPLFTDRFAAKRFKEAVDEVEIPNPLRMRGVADYMVENPSYRGVADYVMENPDPRMVFWLNIAASGAVIGTVSNLVGVDKWLKRMIVKKVLTPKTDMASADKIKSKLSMLSLLCIASDAALAGGMTAAGYYGAGLIKGEETSGIRGSINPKAIMWGGLAVAGVRVGWDLWQYWQDRKVANPAYGIFEKLTNLGFKDADVLAMIPDAMKGTYTSWKAFTISTPAATQQGAKPASYAPQTVYQSAPQPQQAPQTVYQASGQAPQTVYQASGQALQPVSQPVYQMPQQAYQPTSFQWSDPNTWGELLPSYGDAEPESGLLFDQQPLQADSVMGGAASGLQGYGTENPRRRLVPRNGGMGEYLTQGDLSGMERNPRRRMISRDQRSFSGSRGVADLTGSMGYSMPV